MKIGILVLSIGNFGKKGYYNLQEIGLAKALAKCFNEIIVYKLVSLNEEASCERIDNLDNATLKMIPSKKIGSNGKIDCNILDKDLDALICFSDTQIYFPRVYKYCINNNIKLYPYIGTCKSNSKSLIKKYFINFMFKRNIKYYKKLVCFAKTPLIKDYLNKCLINKVYVVPIGLNLDLLKKDYKKYSIAKIKNDFGYNKDEKILLFIGRLSQEKKPLDMIDIYNELIKFDNSYKLLIVGNGYLKNDVINRIHELNLINNVKIIDKIENKDIWQVYRISDYFVNLCDTEIFGMSLLEAMYYSCTPIAIKAPGPNYIIKNNLSGFIVSLESDIIKIVLSGKKLDGHDEIINNFTWDKSAQLIESIIKG